MAPSQKAASEAAAPSADAPPAPKAKAKAKKATPAKGEASAADTPAVSGAAMPEPAAGTLEALLVDLNWDVLPGKEQFQRQCYDLLKAQLQSLCSVYVYYCKASSECTTAEMAMQLHIAGLKKLVQHTALESALLPLDSIIRLFCKIAHGEMHASAKEVPATTAVDLKGFLSFCLQIAFYRQNPRAGVFAPAAAPKEGEAPKKADTAAPITPALKAFIAEALPKAHKLSTTFNSMLAADRAAQQVLQQYQQQLQSWRDGVVSAAGEGGDVSAAARSACIA